MQSLANSVPQTCACPVLLPCYRPAAGPPAVQEQAWSDKIRRASTWWTWGLMGLHFASFVAVYTFLEPRKRQALTAAVSTMLQQQTASIDERLAHLSQAVPAGSQEQQAAESSRQVPAGQAGQQQLQASVEVQQQVLQELQKVQQQLQALTQQQQQQQPAQAGEWRRVGQ